MLSSIGGENPLDYSPRASADDGHTSSDMTEGDDFIALRTDGRYDEDNEDDEGYVPDSLKAFVEDQKNKLTQARDSFFSAMLPDPDLSFMNSIDDGDPVPVSFPEFKSTSNFTSTCNATDSQVNHETLEDINQTPILSASSNPLSSSKVLFPQSASPSTKSHGESSATLCRERKAVIDANLSPSPAAAQIYLSLANTPQSGDDPQVCKSPLFTISATGAHLSQASSAAAGKSPSPAKANQTGSPAPMLLQGTAETPLSNTSLPPTERRVSPANAPQTDSKVQDAKAPKLMSGATEKPLSQALPTSVEKHLSPASTTQTGNKLLDVKSPLLVPGATETSLSQPSATSAEKRLSSARTNQTGNNVQDIKSSLLVPGATETTLSRTPHETLLGQDQRQNDPESVNSEQVKGSSPATMPMLNEQNEVELPKPMERVMECHPNSSSTLRATSSIAEASHQTTPLGRISPQASPTGDKVNASKSKVRLVVATEPSPNPSAHARGNTRSSKSSSGGRMLSPSSVKVTSPIGLPTPTYKRKPSPKEFPSASRASLTDRLTRPTVSSAASRRTITKKTSDTPISKGLLGKGTPFMVKQTSEQVISPLSDPSLSPSNSTSRELDGPPKSPKEGPKPSPKANAKSADTHQTLTNDELPSRISPGDLAQNLEKAATSGLGHARKAPPEEPSISTNRSAAASRGSLNLVTQRRKRSTPQSTMQGSPRISSPLFSPALLDRLTQPTASSRAHRKSSLDGNESVEASSSPRNIAASCASCSISPPKERASSGQSSNMKVSGASDRLLQDTEASRARRFPIKDLLTLSASRGRSPSPPLALINRLNREAAASKARQGQSSPTRKPSPNRATQLDNVHGALPLAGEPPYDSTQPKDSLLINQRGSNQSHFTQETAASRAHRIPSPKHKPSPQAPGDTKDREAIADPSSEQPGFTPATFHRPPNATVPTCAASRMRDVSVRRATGSFEDIPNVCSSLTQHSIPNSNDSHRNRRSSSIQDSRTLGSSSSLSDQSRLLKGTASSRARSVPHLPPQSANSSVSRTNIAEQSRNLKIEQKKKAMSLAANRMARKKVVPTRQLRVPGQNNPTAALRAGKENRMSSHWRHITATVPARLAPPTRSIDNCSTKVMGLTLAQSTDTLRKTLRGDVSDAATRRSESLNRRLTIPKTPNFATSRRLGSKEITEARERRATLAQSSDLHMRGLRSGASVASSTGMSTWQPSHTVPKPPQLATSNRYGSKTPVLRGSDHEVALVNSTEVLKSGLRAQDPELSKRRELKPTIPITPKFHVTTTRKQQKSTEELELEQIERYRANPFKARSTKRSSALEAVETKQSHATEPTPCDALTVTRDLSLRVSKSNEEEDLREMKKQFRAKPAPKFASTPLTQLWHSRMPKRLAMLSPEGSVEVASLPRTSNTLHAKAPNLSTPGRSAKRQAVLEASRRKAEALALQREKVAKQRQQEKIRQELRKAQECRPSVPLDAKPFVLRSEIRGEQHQRKFDEKVRRLEEERRRMTTFHALSYQKSATPPDRKRPDRIVTEVQPFQLSSLARHEEYENDFQRKIAEAEEELKRQTQFKAKPVPKTTYCYTPIASPNRRPLSTRSSVSGLQSYG